ncbi:MAG: helix-turn-helix domain-containing protein [Bacteriovoracales bacterium]|nr:helix-turn-helix domain-containing protein [Bacteriovoracales bacterium]
MPNDLLTEKSRGQHCRQYEIRQHNLAKDLEKAGISKAQMIALKVGDFDFRYVPKTDLKTCQKIKQFVIKHEWLGKMPHRPTHRFIATYGKGGHKKLVGVIVMSIPNAFSHLLGKGYRDREKLISRGACISWSPKNLASSLIMFSVRWMVKNTSYRFFSAYADPQARELGTIYQACNFTYLGQDSGARFQYFDPQNPERGWFNDRLFRKSTSFKRYALELGIDWEKDWGRDRVIWNEMPSSMREQLKRAARDHQNLCLKRPVPRKHKYVYILGRGKWETKRLRARFAKLNPQKIALPYPKKRAAQNGEISDLSLKKRPEKSLKLPTDLSPKRFYSVKEVAALYGISQWAIYQKIKSDPTFPHTNVGEKKRFLIGLKEFERWMQSVRNKTARQTHLIPSGEELLGKGDAP